jgi:hypothetical protein
MGVIPALIIILINPIDFKKYKLIFVNRFPKNDMVHLNWYDDIDGDRVAEKFSIGNNRKEVNNSHLLIYDKHEKVTAQINFEHKLALTRSTYSPFSADITNDGIKEVFILTQNQDSLFLNVYNYSNSRIILNSRFLTKIGGFNDKHDFRFYWVTSEDINNDNCNEIYFSITAEFALSPRRLFRYDFVKDSLISSINTGASFYNPAPFIINDKLLILSGSAAHNNVGPNYPYPYKDTTCWVFGFDKDLKFFFEPVSFNGINSSVTEIMQFWNKFYFNTVQGSNKLISINDKGEIIKTMKFNDPIGHILPIKDPDNKLIYFPRKTGFCAVNIETWKVQSNHKLNDLHNYYFIYGGDIDNDNSFEYIFWDIKEHQVVIFRNDIRHPVYFKLPIDETGINFISTKYNQGITKIMIAGDKQYYTLEYSVNPFYYFKYPVWLLIYLLSVLFVYLIEKVQRKQIEKRQRTEQRLIELQLQNLKNQLDPHFTFNAMNSIGLQIYEENKEKAYDHFVRFARLIRSSLLSSDKIFRSLEEELQFTKDYLEFQKERFENKFNFQFRVDQSIELNKIRVPKMIIQGYAENAVKHAFEGLKRSGLIEIKIEKHEDNITIQIKDNGIGRKASSKPKSEDSGRGMNLMEEQIKLLNQYHKKNIQLRIIDLFDSFNSPSGTLVEIKFQV